MSNTAPSRGHAPATAQPVDVETALARTRAAAVVVGETETLPLTQAVGRFLADAPLSRVDLPPFDNAAMDGYALRHADLDALTTHGLPVTDRWFAGMAPTPLPTGAAAQITTGAMIPAGADCVIRQEDLRVLSPDTTLPPPKASDLPRIVWQGAPLSPPPFHNIRRKSEDLAKGKPVLPAGALLSPERIGLLAGAGLDQVTVRRRVRVGIFSTGNELAEPGTTLTAGQIYNSNRVMLAAGLALPWVELADYAILPDDRAALGAALAKAAAENDVVLTSGGMSVGAADHMLDVLGDSGADMAVLKIAMRPGKPLSLGRIGKALFIGLPGNPFAALVTFSQIALPVLRHVAGAAEVPDPLIACVAGFDYPRHSARREYLPVTWTTRDAMGRPVLEMLGKGASARLSPPSHAKGIAILPEAMAHVRIGDTVMVDPLWR